VGNGGDAVDLRGEAAPRPDRADQFDERLFVFATDDRVGDFCQQVILIQPGIEAEEADVGARVEGAHTARGFDAEAQSGVHGGGDADKRCLRGERIVKLLN